MQTSIVLGSCHTWTMSAIWREVCAVFARALSVSFLLLASTSLDSSILLQASSPCHKPCKAEIEHQILAHACR